MGAVAHLFMPLEGGHESVQSSGSELLPLLTGPQQSLHYTGHLKKRVQWIGREKVRVGG